LHQRRGDRRRDLGRRTGRPRPGCAHVSALRPARRMAVRSIGRTLGRSLLIGLLIGLPVAVATFGDVHYRSTESPATYAYRALGNADAKLLVTPGRRLTGFEMRSEGGQPYRYKRERDPDTVDVAALLPPGTRMEESTI